MTIACRTELRVRYAEVDQMGAVNSARYFEWFELGRIELLRQAGVPYPDLEKRGVMLPVVAAHCDYLVRLGYDEIVSVETSLALLSPARLRFDFRVLRREGAAQVVAAAGFTENAVVGPNGKPMRLPADVEKALGGSRKT